MRQAVAAALILGTAAFGQEPVVQRSTIWIDAAKRGSMPVAMRGTGTLTANMTAEFKIPESLVFEVKLGQAVSVDTHHGVVSGKVMRIDASVMNGTATIEVKIEGDLPPEARAGAAVEGAIQIATLNDVIL